MKKFIGIALGIIIIGGIFASMDSDSESKDEKDAEVTQSTVQEEAVEEAAATDMGDLGNYHVSINDFVFAKDYNGDDVAVITYEFTNNDDKNAIFLTSISAKAFQNGIGLDRAIMLEEGYVDSLTEIQPGATLLLKVPYKLADTVSPVSVEATTLFNNTNKLVKEFVLQ
ncbi:DUF5067 domain-containing protein [Enterococcus sp. CWB-B31]|uniref:DUF5067 domain-containing protein n=1 Tax=Enterococcus sp. CWB-B31 TaxID=2885159 RepID=UPI001E456004|nr:DUF5067 domain-containing protein [Enterococcus sp. CWB-B31]MCB5956317.1 DUF5067 domain-containing protein [Enterococcus sp. CWB-B31]